MDFSNSVTQLEDEGNCRWSYAAIQSTGLPKRVYMDQYSAYKSQLVTVFAKVLGIEVQFSAPYHKTGMGLYEPANGLVGRWLKSYMVIPQETGIVHFNGYFFTVESPSMRLLDTPRPK